MLLDQQHRQVAELSPAPSRFRVGEQSCCKAVVITFEKTIDKTISYQSKSAQKNDIALDQESKVVSSGSFKHSRLWFAKNYDIDGCKFASKNPLPYGKRILRAEVRAVVKAQRHNKDATISTAIVIGI